MNERSKSFEKSKTEIDDLVKRLQQRLTDVSAEPVDPNTLADLENALDHARIYLIKQPDYVPPPRPPIASDDKKPVLSDNKRKPDWA
jgi:hypothetical protein